MRIAALFLLLAVPCAVAAQAPPNKLEADLAKAKADYDRDPSSAENAFIRILSDPGQGPSFFVARLAEHLNRFRRDPHYEFWPDAISILDDAMFNLPLVHGHRQLTDVYLLGLAVTHGGRLVTFDQSIPLGAVKGATTEALEVIAAAG